MVTGIEASFDPYDIWATKFGVSVKRRYYQGALYGKICAVFLSLCDLTCPDIVRFCLGSKPLVYPAALAHEILRFNMIDPGSDSRQRVYLNKICAVAIKQGNPSYIAWGLGFPWMSKNGLYGPDLPFITHTPYVMEALLSIAEKSENSSQAMHLFDQTWNFLESLQTMFSDDDKLALSYAPVVEPRIVVNANSYAAMSYALHAVHGKTNRRLLAAEKAAKLVRWVIHNQQTDGHWTYFADKQTGNFVDCFHSCFVLKNLNKVKRSLPELSAIIQPPIENGWLYVKQNFYDQHAGLCRRFVVRAQRDPFRWDLYDQAEYLGLLVDFNLLDEAQQFANHVESKFRKGVNWYCRIDVFGRCWGKNFLRWGITPFWYQKARLQRAMGGN